VLKRPKYIFLLLLCFCFSCKKDVGLVNRGNFPDEISAIFSSNCATSGCHNEASHEAAAGLNLETWESLFNGSNNGSPVIPYNSAFSSLCYFINTYSELGLQNAPTMPLNGSALTYAQVKQIKDWIDAGAADKDGNIKWSDPVAGKLYIVNQGCDAVTIIDAASGLPSRYVQLPRGSTPHQVRVSSDGKFYYVLFINRNFMQKYNCSDNKLVGNIPLTPLAAGTGPEDALDWNTFNITKDGTTAYCVSWTSLGKVSKVDLENMKLIKMMPGLKTPHGIVLSPSEDRVFVAAQQGNYITELDADLNLINEHVLENNPQSDASSLNPHDMIFSPDGSEIYITCQNTNEVRVFNIASNQVNKVFSVSNTPQEIIYSSKNKSYYVSCMGDGSASATGSVIAISESGSVSILKCGAQPHGIAVDQQRNLLYVVSRNVSSNGPLPHHSSQCSGRNGFVNLVDLRNFVLTKQKYELSVDPYFISIR
jgi:DNA-binding beta-propeller fold protein YncE